MQGVTGEQKSTKTQTFKCKQDLHWLLQNCFFRSIGEELGFPSESQALLFLLTAVRHLSFPLFYLWILCLGANPEIKQSESFAVCTS